MKQLIIVRHGKSDWGNADLTDFDRPLNTRGHKNAPEMVERLIKKGLKPALIVSSPALRAITTANYFAKGWNIETSAILQEETIYEANVKTLLQIVNRLKDSDESVALFGHNPGLTDFINYLTDEYASMPTCGVAIIMFPFNQWELVSAETGNLSLFDYPKSSQD